MQSLIERIVRTLHTVTLLRPLLVELVDRLLLESGYVDNGFADCLLSLRGNHSRGIGTFLSSHSSLPNDENGYGDLRRVFGGIPSYRSDRRMAWNWRGFSYDSALYSGWLL